MPTRHLLVSMRDFQKRFFAKRFAEQLQADGQLRIFREAARNADATNSREIAGDGEDVG